MQLVSFDLYISHFHGKVSWTTLTGPPTSPSMSVQSFVQLLRPVKVSINISFEAGALIDF